MRNNSGREFWFFSLSLVSLRVADVVITFLVSPDLRWEMNPLVSVAGLGWPALILANILGLTLVIGLLHYSRSQARSDHPQEAGYSRKEFISHYLFGDRTSFRKIYYAVPYNRASIVHYAAYVFIRVLTIWSLIIVLHNALVWHSESFRNLMAEAKLWLTIYALLVILVPVYSLRFFNSLYRDYRSAGRLKSPA